MHIKKDTLVRHIIIYCLLSALLYSDMLWAIPSYIESDKLGKDSPLEKGDVDFIEVIRNAASREPKRLREILHSTAEWEEALRPENLASRILTNQKNIPYCLFILDIIQILIQDSPADVAKTLRGVIDKIGEGIVKDEISEILKQIQVERHSTFKNGPATAEAPSTQWRTQNKGLAMVNVSQEIEEVIPIGDIAAGIEFPGKIVTDVLYKKAKDSSGIYASYSESGLASVQKVGENRFVFKIDAFLLHIYQLLKTHQLGKAYPQITERLAELDNNELLEAFGVIFTAEFRFHEFAENYFERFFPWHLQEEDPDILNTEVLATSVGLMAFLIYVKNTPSFNPSVFKKLAQILDTIDSPHKNIYGYIIDFYLRKAENNQFLEALINGKPSDTKKALGEIARMLKRHPNGNYKDQEFDVEQTYRFLQAFKSITSKDLLEGSLLGAERHSIIGTDTSEDLPKRPVVDLGLSQPIPAAVSPFGISPNFFETKPRAIGKLKKQFAREFTDWVLGRAQKVPTSILFKIVSEVTSRIYFEEFNRQLDVAYKRKGACVIVLAEEIPTPLGPRKGIRVIDGAFGLTTSKILFNPDTNDFQRLPDGQEGYIQHLEYWLTGQTDKSPREYSFIPKTNNHEFRFPQSQERFPICDKAGIPLAIRPTIIGRFRGLQIVEYTGTEREKVVKESYYNPETRKVEDRYKRVKLPVVNHTAQYRRNIYGNDTIYFYLYESFKGKSIQIRVDMASESISEIVIPKAGFWRRYNWDKIQQIKEPFSEKTIAFVIGEFWQLPQDTVLPDGVVEDIRITGTRENSHIYLGKNLKFSIPPGYHGDTCSVFQKRGIPVLVHLPLKFFEDDRKDKRTDGKIAILKGHCIASIPSGEPQYKLFNALMKKYEGLPADRPLGTFARELNDFIRLHLGTPQIMQTFPQTVVSTLDGNPVSSTSHSFATAHSREALPRIDSQSVILENIPTDKKGIIDRSTTLSLHKLTGVPNKNVHLVMKGNVILRLDYSPHDFPLHSVYDIIQTDDGRIVSIFFNNHIYADNVRTVHYRIVYDIDHNPIDSNPSLLPARYMKSSKPLIFSGGRLKKRGEVDICHTHFRTGFSDNRYIGYFVEITRLPRHNLYIVDLLDENGLIIDTHYFDLNRRQLKDKQRKWIVPELPRSIRDKRTFWQNERQRAIIKHEMNMESRYALSPVFIERMRRIQIFARQYSIRMAWMQNALRQRMYKISQRRFLEAVGYLGMIIFYDKYNTWAYSKLGELFNYLETISKGTKTPVPKLMEKIRDAISDYSRYIEKLQEEFGIDYVNEGSAINNRPPGSVYECCQLFNKYGFYINRQLLGFSKTRLEEILKELAIKKGTAKGDALIRLTKSDVSPYLATPSRKGKLESIYTGIGIDPIVIPGSKIENLEKGRIINSLHKLKIMSILLNLMGIPTNEQAELFQKYPQNLHNRNSRLYLYLDVMTNPQVLEWTYCVPGQELAKLFLLDSRRFRSLLEELLIRYRVEKRPEQEQRLLGEMLTVYRLFLKDKPPFEDIINRFSSLMLLVNQDSFIFKECEDGIRLIQTILSYRVEQLKQEATRAIDNLDFISARKFYLQIKDIYNLLMTTTEETYIFGKPRSAKADERSEAIPDLLARDCFVADAPRNDVFERTLPNIYEETDNWTRGIDAINVAISHLDSLREQAKGRDPVKIRNMLQLAEEALREKNYGDAYYNAMLYLQFMPEDETAQGIRRQSLIALQSGLPSKIEILRKRHWGKRIHCAVYMRGIRWHFPMHREKQYADYILGVNGKQAVCEYYEKTNFHDEKFIIRLIENDQTVNSWEIIFNPHGYLTVNGEIVIDPDSGEPLEFSSAGATMPIQRIIPEFGYSGVVKPSHGPASGTRRRRGERTSSRLAPAQPLDYDREIAKHYGIPVKYIPRGRDYLTVIEILEYARTKDVLFLLQKGLRRDILHAPAVTTAKDRIDRLAAKIHSITDILQPFSFTPYQLREIIISLVQAERFTIHTINYLREVVEYTDFKDKDAIYNALAREGGINLAEFVINLEKNDKFRELMAFFGLDQLLSETELSLQITYGDIRALSNIRAMVTKYNSVTVSESDKIEPKELVRTSDLKESGFNIRMILDALRDAIDRYPMRRALKDLAEKFGVRIETLRRIPGWGERFKKRHINSLSGIYQLVVRFNTDAGDPEMVIDPEVFSTDFENLLRGDISISDFRKIVKNEIKKTKKTAEDDAKVLHPHVKRIRKLPVLSPAEIISGLQMVKLGDRDILRDITVSFLTMAREIYDAKFPDSRKNEEDFYGLAYITIAEAITDFVSSQYDPAKSAKESYDSLTKRILTELDHALKSDVFLVSQRQFVALNATPNGEAPGNGDRERIANPVFRALVDDRDMVSEITYRRMIAVLTGFTPDEQTALILKYGLFDIEKLPPEEIESQTGITKQELEQLSARFIARIGSVVPVHSARKTKDIAGLKADHRGVINPKLAEWIRQGKVIDYYYENGQWMPYRVEYRENYIPGTTDDKGEMLLDGRYQFRDEGQRRLSKILKSCGYTKKLIDRLRFRIVLEETASAWMDEKEHSSYIHAGERASLIWFGEYLFRDLLTRDEDPLRKEIFLHEKEHLKGNHGIDKEEGYTDLLDRVNERCREIDNRIENTINRIMEILGEYKLSVDREGIRKILLDRGKDKVDIKELLRLLEQKMRPGLVFEIAARISEPLNELYGGAEYLKDTDDIITAIIREVCNTFHPGSSAINGLDEETKDILHNCARLITYDKSGELLNLDENIFLLFNILEDVRGYNPNIMALTFARAYLKERLKGITQEELAAIIGNLKRVDGEVFSEDMSLEGLIDLFLTTENSRLRDAIKRYLAAKDNRYEEELENAFRIKKVLIEGQKGASRLLSDRESQIRRIALKILENKILEGERDWDNLYGKVEENQRSFIVQDINGLVNLIIGDKPLRMVMDPDGKTRIVLPFTYREAGIKEAFINLKRITKAQGFGFMAENRSVTAIDENGIGHTVSTHDLIKELLTQEFGIDSSDIHLFGRDILSTRDTIDKDRAGYGLSEDIPLSRQLVFLVDESAHKEKVLSNKVISEMRANRIKVVVKGRYTGVRASLAVCLMWLGLNEVYNYKGELSGEAIGILNITGAQDIDKIIAEVREKGFFVLPDSIKFTELLDHYRAYQQILEVMA